MNEKYHLVVSNRAGGHPQDWEFRGEYDSDREAAFAAIKKNRYVRRQVGAGGRANTYAVRSPSGEIIDADYHYGQEYDER